MHGKRSDRLFIKIHHIEIHRVASLTSLTQATDRLAANPGATDKNYTGQSNGKLLTRQASDWSML